MADTIDISSIQTFTDAQLLTVYRYAMATGAFRQEVTISGRSLRVPDQTTVMKVIGWLEQRIQDDANLSSGEGGNVSVVQFDDPT